MKRLLDFVLTDQCQDEGSRFGSNFSERKIFRAIVLRVNPLTLRSFFFGSAVTNSVIHFLLPFFGGTNPLVNEPGMAGSVSKYKTRRLSISKLVHRTATRRIS